MMSPPREGPGRGTVPAVLEPGGYPGTWPDCETGCVVGFTRSYRGDTAQVRLVRAAVALLLDGCPVADDLVLIASEIAANAAVHSRSAAPGGLFTVRAGGCPGRHTWVAVSDHGGPWPEAARDSGRPHGLDIAGLLARDWGTGGGDGSGRTVWAVLDWPAGTGQAVLGRQPAGSLKNDTAGGSLR